MRNEFRIIPGYELYEVNRFGIIREIATKIILAHRDSDGYKSVSVKKPSLTKMLQVHRAVALVWVVNTNPEKFKVVNHLDGNPSNNLHTNLEWTDYTGNNLHAINNGLRPDNIPCKIRDYYSKEVIEFNSIAQAAAYMGKPKNYPICCLRFKQFGKLVSGRYEFRFANDTTPWFYENREKLRHPTRFIVTVTNEDGNSQEYFYSSDLLKAYQLYRTPSKSMPGLADWGNQIYPNLTFTVRDSYNETLHRNFRQTSLSKLMPIRARKFGAVVDYKSLTECAKSFNVDRSSITNRLSNGRDLDGWTFAILPL